MTSVNLVEATEVLTDRILSAYEDVLLEAGYDPTDDRPAAFSPVMAEAVLETEEVHVSAPTRRYAAEASAAEARYHEALLLGRNRTAALDG
ncbi:hypothetical protein [Microbacterium sp. A93]|uniref:hypothetical protein n=1 Tax=Microbacterium sp. A93 TaxID=3450716 RepID=UPI003F4333FE